MGIHQKLIRKVEKEVGRSKAWGDIEPEKIVASVIKQSRLLEALNNVRSSMNHLAWWSEFETGSTPPKIKRLLAFINKQIDIAEGMVGRREH